METYDLAVFWEWDYDKQFNAILQKHAASKNISILLIDPVSLPAIEKSLSENELYFKWYLDRASETDPRFSNLLLKCQDLKINGLNPANNVHRALSKAYMHRLLLNRQIPLPETIILPPFSQKPELPFFTFETIGIPFVIKPANGGGGEGVHLGLTELSQVSLCRKEFPESEYLIQQTVIPKIANSRPVWLRVFYVCEQIYFSFWNPETKIFAPSTSEDFDPVFTKTVESIVLEIAKISKLRFFSCEIAVKPDNSPVVIDYVNDPVDLRPKSSHKDGIPDELLDKIVCSVLLFLQNSNGAVSKAITN